MFLVTQPNLRVQRPWKNWKIRDARPFRSVQDRLRIGSAYPDIADECWSSQWVSGVDLWLLVLQISDNHISTQ